MSPDLSNIIIREARPGDARFVAWAVLTALDLDDSEIERFEQSSADTGSLYSWRHALIAEIDGSPAGCIVSYPGDDYDRMRRYTWPRIWNYGGRRRLDPAPDIESMELETAPGEYYLDTLAILPRFRGHDLGTLLIKAAIDRGLSEGYSRFTLIADIHKTGLLRYYERIGFRISGEMTFFGHRYYKMQLDPKSVN